MNISYTKKGDYLLLDKIYYVDDNGIEYWHGKPIESKEATKEEQEEMEKMLESFKEMEEDIKWLRHS